MPFAYFGAKHGLSRYYSPPMFGHIIEPFAGSAGYSCRWASANHRVTLVDRDPDTVRMLRRLQTMTVDDVAAIGRRFIETGETDELFLMSVGGTSQNRVMDGTYVKVTTRMIDDWKSNSKRIANAVERMRSWEIIEGDYRDIANETATWFVDPPYEPSDVGDAGRAYRFGSDQIDYAELAEWCRSRRGQVIVCEQAPAAWLPFRPFMRQQTGAARVGGSERVEVVWEKRPASSSLRNRRAKASR